MTLYLQRLFDRAQALQAEVTAASRLDAPSAELDQRLQDGVPVLSLLAGLTEAFEPEMPVFERPESLEAHAPETGPRPVQAPRGDYAKPVPGPVSEIATPRQASPFRPAVVTDPVKPAPVTTRLERHEPGATVEHPETTPPVATPPPARKATRTEPGERTVIREVTRVDTRHETVVREVEAPPARPEPVIRRPEPGDAPVTPPRVEARPTVTLPSVREVERIVETPGRIISRIEPAPLHESQPMEASPEIAPPRQGPPPKRETVRSEVAAAAPSPPISLSQRPDGPAILSAEQASMIGPLDRLRPALTIRGLRRR